MLLGAHFSIDGGIEKAVERAAEYGCNTLQLFTKNSLQWRAKSLKEEEISVFRSMVASKGVEKVVAHAAYIINIGSPDSTIYKNSLSSLLLELTRATELHIPYLDLHPGSHKEGDRNESLDRIAKTINEIYSSHDDITTMLLLENSAGQGTNLCHRFEEIERILSKIEMKNKVGICYDTAHGFAAGYDLRTKETYEKVMEEFDRILGLDLLKAMHLNDSKSPLGSRIDRHQHIGNGYLGLKSFELLLNDKTFKDIPFIIETPKGVDAAGVDLDTLNFSTLRSLVK